MFSVIWCLYMYIHSVVEYMDEESAMKAIQMFDRMKLMGREIGVKEVG